MFWVDKFSTEIKELYVKKQELLNQRDEMFRRVKAGEDYFHARVSNPNARDLVAGAERMISILSECRELDVKIKDIDLTIISKLEMYLGNFTARAKMPSRMNEAGDLIKYDEIALVPFKDDDENLQQVTPDDIWFLKMIKQAFKATNISFIEKDEI